MFLPHKPIQKICQVCQTPFNSTDHEPFVLVCGHNVCPVYIEANFKKGGLKCPACGKWNEYETRKDILKDVILGVIIKQAQGK